MPRGALSLGPCVPPQYSDSRVFYYWSTLSKAELQSASPRCGKLNNYFQHGPPKLLPAIVWNIFASSNEALLHVMEPSIANEKYEIGVEESSLQLPNTAPILPETAAIIVSQTDVVDQDCSISPSQRDTEVAAWTVLCGGIVFNAILAGEIVLLNYHPTFPGSHVFSPISLPS
jgi:hypothetical protein